MILEVGGMIKMDQYEYIRIAHRVYGKSIRQIQRETGHARPTIRKVLRGELVGYKSRETQVYPVLGGYKQIIEGWLKEDKEQGKKQRHTARRIYNRLKEEYGFKGSESAVRRYVRWAKARLGITDSKAYIPLEPECGKEAEVDWGRAGAIINDIKTPVRFLAMRSRYSGKHFVRAYLCEKQQAFFDAHIHAFNFFGGIFPTLVYDNLTSAVKEILVGRKRVEQEEFIKFRSYYNFEARFCNPGQAHEKGGIEGGIRFIRQNYFVPVPRVKDIEELNEELLRRCGSYGDHKLSGRDKTVNELFEEEKAGLISLPEVPFSNIRTVDGRVNSYSTVIIDNNHYSVPRQYVGLRVHINLGIDRVDIYWEGKRIASHKRVYGISKWQLDPQHYLELLKQRPGAFETAKPINQWRKEWPKALEDLLERFKASQGHTAGIKDFINVLMLYSKYPVKQIETAVELAAKKGLSTSDGVKHILEYPSSQPVIESLSGWPSVPASDPKVYGELGGVK